MEKLTRVERLALMKIFKNLCKCGMFVGKYDATNGNENFMFGISTVMETLAYLISDKVGETFSKAFTNNMIASEDKARSRKTERIEQDGSEGSRSLDYYD